MKYYLSLFLLIFFTQTTLSQNISSEKKYRLVNKAHSDLFVTQEGINYQFPLKLTNRESDGDKLIFFRQYLNEFTIRRTHAESFLTVEKNPNNSDIRPIFRTTKDRVLGKEFIFRIAPTEVPNEFFIITKNDGKYFEAIESQNDYAVSLKEKNGRASQKWILKEIQKKELDTQRAYQIDRGILGTNNSSNIGHKVAISANKKILVVGSLTSDKKGFGEIFSYKITDDGHLKRIGVNSTIYGNSAKIDRTGTHMIVCDRFATYGNKEYSGFCYALKYNEDLDSWQRISDGLYGENKYDLFGEYHSISPDAKTIKIVATQKFTTINPVGNTSTTYKDDEGYTKTYELKNGRYQEVKKEEGYDSRLFYDRLPTSLEFSQIIDRYGDPSINQIAKSAISTDGNTLVIGDYYFDHYEGRALVFDYSYYQKEIPNEKFFNIFHSKTKTKLSRTNQIVRVHDREGEKWRLEKIPYTKYFRIVSANDGLSIGDQNGQVLLIDEHNQLLTDKESLQWELIAKTIHGKTFFDVKNRSTGKFLSLESDTNWIVSLNNNPNDYSKWKIQADYSVDCEPLKIQSKSVKNLCPTSDDIVKGNRNFDSNVAARVTVAPLPPSLGDKSKLVVRIGLKLEGKNGTVVEKYWDKELVSLRNKVIHTNGLPSVAVATKTLPESGGEFLDCKPGKTHRIFFEENSLVDYVDIIADTGNDDIDNDGDCNCDARIVEVKFKSFEICTENNEVEKQRNENQTTPIIM